jgi:hypothetical protein
MTDQNTTDQNTTAAEDAPLAMANLRFIDHADGTMAIEATHSGEFDAMNQAHACLRAVIQFLPQVCTPVGTRIEGNTGIRVPITDGDRYQAMRTLALIPEASREAILEQIATEGYPQNEIEFDKMADKLVEMCRGLDQVPTARIPEQAPDLKLVFDRAAEDGEQAGDAGDASDASA